MAYFPDSIYLDPYPYPYPGVEHICQDDFYLIRILAACISG